MDFKKLVSVIIPVYNVEKYLNECMDSVVNQTYRNLEIILINDGSTDYSGAICEEWVKKDSRVRYISKDNEGLGRTRNIGIKAAQGEYLAFVDSDDWVDRTFIEKLYLAVVNDDLNMSECDVYRVQEECNTQEYVSGTAIMGKALSVRERIMYGYDILSNTFTKRSIWINNSIIQPGIPYEDIAVYPLLVVSCGEVGNVHEALYYYRNKRKESISNKPENVFYLLNASKYIIEQFIERKLFSQYEKELKCYVLKCISRNYIKVFTHLEKEMSRQFQEQLAEMMETYFTEWNNSRYIIVGGYNLVRIINKLQMFHDPCNRFNFSSIISICSDGGMDISIEHRNHYRKHMIQKDFNKSLWIELKKSEIKYIFIDFLEERHDIIEKNGKFFTKSDAFDETGMNLEDARVISRFSPECKVIWEEKCLAFIEGISRYINRENIYLIENYLAEEYGDINGTRPYEEIDHIRKINCLLKEYYSFFKTNCIGIQCIDAYREPNYFTDQNYVYGRIPSHLNELVDIDIAAKISGKIHFNKEDRGLIQ